MLFDLPSSVAFGGRRWAIRTDYRDVLRVLAAFADPELTDGEKAFVCLKNLYPEFERIPAGLRQAAFDAAVGFIDGREEGEEVLQTRPHPPASQAPSPEGKAFGECMVPTSAENSEGATEGKAFGEATSSDLAALGHLPLKGKAFGERDVAVEATSSVTALRAAPPSPERPEGAESASAAQGGNQEVPGFACGETTFDNSKNWQKYRGARRRRNPRASECAGRGATEGKAPIQPRTMDWEQDAALIFPAVNRVAGFEVRAAKQLHWWTFLGYFMEIRDSTYATILALRQKKARGKKLEKEEAEFWRRNAAACELKRRLTAKEREEKRRLEEMIGGK